MALRLSARRRVVFVAVVCVLAGHALAVLGLWRGMPEAPYGDEQRFAWLLVQAALRIVWLPWMPLTEDAFLPAPVARWVAPAVAGWGFLEWLVERARNPLRLLAIRRLGGHIVMPGVSTHGLALVAHWTRQGRLVAVVADSADERARALDAGAATLALSPDAVEVPARSGLLRASAFWSVTASDTENMERAARMQDYLAANRDRVEGLVMGVVHVGDPFLRARLDERLDRLAALEVVQMKLYSTAQIAARRLLRDCSPDRFERIPSVGSIWVLGLGTLGEELLLQAVRLAPRSDGRRLSVVAADRKAGERRRSLLDRWPGIEQVADIAFVDGRFEEGETLAARLLEVAPPPRAVYVCAGSEDVNLGCALALLSALERCAIPPPPVYVGAPRAAAMSTASRAEIHPWLRWFGGHDWLAEEVLHSERLDAVARRIHERYLEASLARGEAMGGRRSLCPWALLPEDLKDDNRALADHHFVKLADLGVEVVPGAGGPASPAFQWREGEIERLARVEHDRWLTQRTLAGWRYDPVRDDDAKRHPDMVAYEALSEPARERDRAVVRDLPPLFAEVGLALRRTIDVHFVAERPDLDPGDGFADGVRKALGALGDEVPVVWFRAGDRAAEAAARAARAAGARLGLLMAQAGVADRSLIGAAAFGRFTDGPSSPHDAPGRIVCWIVDDLAGSAVPAGWRIDRHGRLAEAVVR